MRAPNRLACPSWGRGHISRSHPDIAPHSTWFLAVLSFVIRVPGNLEAQVVQSIPLFPVRTHNFMRARFLRIFDRECAQRCLSVVYSTKWFLLRACLTPNSFTHIVVVSSPTGSRSADTLWVPTTACITVLSSRHKTVPTDRD